MNPLRLLVGVLIRTVTVLAVVAVAFAWALVDGVRRGFVVSLLLRGAPDASAG